MCGLSGVGARRRRLLDRVTEFRAHLEQFDDLGRRRLGLEGARDKLAERGIVRLAALYGDARHHETLVDFAQARAGNGPIRDPEHRDFVREAEEEVADLANYLCWEIQRRGGQGQHLATALAFAALAWDALQDDRQAVTA